jgi:signal transduction histidine kinase
MFLIALSGAIKDSNLVVFSRLIFSVGVVCLLPLLLNHYRFFNLSRWILCCVPPTLVTLLSITHKFLYPERVDMVNYLDVRFFLIACMVIPLLTIPANEKKVLIPSVMISGLLLVSLDLIFNWVGVGYFDLVNKSKGYYYEANFYSLITYGFLLFSLLFEKRLSEKIDQNNRTLIASLNKANKNLEQQKKEILEQNSEISAQAEKLVSNQEKLMEANAVIEEQKEELLAIQQGLETEIAQSNIDLKLTNEELVKRNQELQQFSYSISHNLRGPLARLLGLTNLMNYDDDNLSTEQKELTQLVTRSARELDEVIHDLSKIMDVRNELHRIKEKVSFQEEWEKVLRSLATFVEPDMIIKSDFKETEIVYTIRPVLTSVFYNLLSNAIKYRSPNRTLNVEIRTKRTATHQIQLDVTDNGLGMNMQQFQGNIFGLYKRFHTHTDGKGLGLYLIKLQVESMGGTIEVASQLNVGSTFSVRFNEPAKVEGQVVFENEFGFLFYNARTNCVGIVWEKQPTSNEYRLLFEKVIEMVRLYHTAYWISDLRKQGKISVEDQVWLASSGLPEAVKNGLKKIAAIYDETQINEDYRARISDAFTKLKTEVHFFTELEKAEECIEKWWSTDFSNH